MGLRDKIKGAIDGGRDDDVYDNNTHTTSGSHATSGTHGPTGTHAPSGTYAAQNDPKYGGTNIAGTVGGRDTQAGSYQNPPITNDHHSNPVGGSIGHRQTDSGVNFGDNTKNDKYGATANRQDPYWGSMGQGGGRNSPPGTSHALGGEDERNRLQRKNLPLRPNEQPGASTNLGGARPDDVNRGPVASSGGTYNTVAGAGSRDYDNNNNNNNSSSSSNSHGSHTLNAVGYQNQPSGIRGQNPTAGDGYDSRLRDRDMGRDSRATVGAGAGAGAGAGVGAGAGLTGAGLATGRGGDFEQRADREGRDMGLNPSDQYQAGGGVPQSSMLDPYQTGPNAGRTGQGVGGGFGTDRSDPRFGSSDRDGRGVQTGGPGGFNASSTTGGAAAAAYGTSTSADRNAGPVHDSHVANKLDPRVDSDRDGSHTLGGASGRQGPGPGNDGRTGLGTANLGPGHFGPAHEGAKVMHRCAGCGLDNDISQYFRKDAVYRMS